MKKLRYKLALWIYPGPSFSYGTGFYTFAKDAKHIKIEATGGGLGGSGTIEIIETYK